ncbi:Rhs element Vgr protein [Candidatus Bathyarchaeota archaeon]|nr:Rhs element Vgr protein [Candidatus Bathyarchaeota archaeon]MBS7634396.1 Rhs element Vgr protein [Candidatus Bathyarchaeota archaeon]
MIEVIKKIVEEEIKKTHIAELGVVTSIFPHSSESDKDNYECNVKLKYRDIELRRVPVATQHIGLANIPNIGDLVLVTFINGDINAPVVVGRLYTDEDRPPVSKEEEIVYIPPYSKSSSLRRIHLEFPGGIIFSITDDEVSIKAGRTILKIDRNGDISIESNAKVNVKANQDISLSANNISIESRGKLEIKSGATAKLEASGTLDIKGALVNIN